MRNIGEMRRRAGRINYGSDLASPRGIDSIASQFTPGPRVRKAALEEEDFDWDIFDVVGIFTIFTIIGFLLKWMFEIMMRRFLM